jgi:flagellin-specific chaperone FliS
MTMDGNIRRGDEFAAYRSVEGLGAKPEEFMSMALDTLRLMMMRAEAAIKAGDKVARAQALSSAGRIAEFMLGLTGSDRGTLSDRLARIYKFLLAAIAKGNAANDATAVAAGRFAVEHIDKTWRGIFQAGRTAK